MNRVRVDVHLREPAGAQLLADAEEVFLAWQAVDDSGVLVDDGGVSFAQGADLVLPEVLLTEGASALRLVLTTTAAGATQALARLGPAALPSFLSDAPQAVELSALLLPLRQESLLDASVAATSDKFASCANGAGDVWFFADPDRGILFRQGSWGAQELDVTIVGDVACDARADGSVVVVDGSGDVRAGIDVFEPLFDDIFSGNEVVSPVLVAAGDGVWVVTQDQVYFSGADQILYLDDVDQRRNPLAAVLPNGSLLISGGTNVVGDDAYEGSLLVAWNESSSSWETTTQPALSALALVQRGNQAWALVDTGSFAPVNNEGVLGTDRTLAIHGLQVLAVRMLAGGRTAILALREDSQRIVQVENSPTLLLHSDRRLLEITSGDAVLLLGGDAGVGAAVFATDDEFAF